MTRLDSNFELYAMNFKDGFVIQLCLNNKPIDSVLWKSYIVSCI